MRNRIEGLRIRGYRSIRDSGEIVPGDITVVIGPNGAGKSNFVSFFRLLSWMLNPPGQLGEYLAHNLPPSKLLHLGPEITRELEAEIRIRTESGLNDYSFRLTYAAGDTFVFTDERWRFSSFAVGGEAPWHLAGAGHRESALLQAAEQGNTTARVIRDLLRRVAVYQFHNTSLTSRLRQSWRRGDNRYLKEDGANLAAILCRLKGERPEYYARIVEVIRRAVPFFADFDFDESAEYVRLSWQELHSDALFDSSQAADGMLRLIALFSLLLLPGEHLPDVLILDEPELGLHPAAIGIAGGLIRSLSASIQVIVATQSPALVDTFSAEELLVLERPSDPENGRNTGPATRFLRLDEARLTEWLENYSLGDLWQKNVIGGKP